ncbi:MAG TPA: hypothetical protein VG937_21110 [Polyangiaceae bacterium]|nr:hypothetical protein [Polyangiaceae bacterium]
MKTAWLNLLASGLVLALAATACKVEVSDGDDESGGTSSTGGKSTGGSATTGGTKTTGGMSSGGTSSTGGTATTGGKATTGGTTSTGGSEPVACDGVGKASTPLASCEFEPADLMGPVGPCLTCISKANTCCTLLKSCYGDNPLNQCGYGGPTTSDNEFLCYQDCLVTKAKAAGGAYDPDRDPEVCADMCATPGCGAIGDATNELIGCMHMNCEDECFVAPAQ